MPAAPVPASPSSDGSTRRPGGDAWQAVAWSRERLLPVRCPGCGRSGAHAVALPFVVASTSKEEEQPRGEAPQREATPPWERWMHWCELCFEHRERQITRRWALLWGLIILAVSTGLVTALWGGRWTRAAEAVVLIVVWGAITTATWRWASRRELPGERTTLCLDPEGGSDVLLTDSSVLVDNLREAGAQQVALPKSVLARLPLTLAGRLRSHILRWPLPLALGTWGGLVLLGNAEMRVFNAGERSLELLIDGRRALRLPARRFESPHFGAHVDLPAGWHELTLLDGKGQLLGEQRIEVWPGSQWLAGVRPPGHCVYLDERDYSLEGQSELPAARTRRVLLQPESLVFELPVRVDSWFQPLAGPDSEGATRETAPSWASAPGLRHALRLLPCADPDG